MTFEHFILFQILLGHLTSKYVITIICTCTCICKKKLLLLIDEFISMSNWYMHVFTGDYMCSAVNLVGSDEAEVSLHVVGESKLGTYS